MTGDVEIGANAGTQAFKDYLFKTLGLPVLKTTAKNAGHSRPTAGRLEARRSEAECAGTPGAIRDAHGASIDDQTMVMLAEWCAEHRPELVPLFELVQEYRKWSKLKTTYIDGYLRFINPASGRIHPDLLPLATETGRFACRRPNLQNQCQPGNDYVGVRNFIVSPEGWLLMEADYSQVELRIVAYLSQDAVMLDAYKNGEDIHSITTSAVFGISREEAADKHHSEYKHRRTVAKGTMFGILYGIGAKGLSVNLKASAGVRASVEQCEQYIAGIKARYTNLAAWQQYAKETARRRQYAQDCAGTQALSAGHPLAGLPQARFVGAHGNEHAGARSSGGLPETGDGSVGENTGGQALYPSRDDGTMTASYLRCAPIMWMKRRRWSRAAWKPCRRLRTLCRWWQKLPLGKGTVSWNEYS